MFDLSHLSRIINPGISPSSPGDLTAVGNTLYFLADDGSTGYELWKSDGTNVGTMPVINLLPGSGNGVSWILSAGD